MKKCLGIFIASIIALGMTSCSEDFDIAAPYKDITVVYGLLNIGEPVQYIRIQKAFLDPNSSALKGAKIADSNYYRDITVRMKEFTADYSLISDVTLQKVDLDTLGSPKLPGVFFSYPERNIAYRYTKLLNAGHNYRLVITNNETGNVDSADTKVVDTLTSSFNVAELSKSKPQIDFSFTKRPAKYLLSLDLSNTNGVYFEGYIKFNYVDVENGSDKKDTFFVWNFDTYPGGNQPKETPSLFSYNDQFLNTFHIFIPAADAGRTRELDSADVYVWGADKNYYNYIYNTQSQGGLTADQIHPVYTTIRGKDVLGVFGSRAKRIRYNIPLSDASLDSLKKSPITKDLGFIGRSDH